MRFGCSFFLTTIVSSQVSLTFTAMTSFCFPRFHMMKLCRGPFLISLAIAAVMASTSLLPLLAQLKSDPRNLFKYDYSKDFDLKKKGSETRENVVIEDIDYASFQNRH